MRGQLHGILIIDKPAGWTSHDVVAWVRKWAGERKVGHAGTLDPAATGVLPIALNDGTRILEFLSDDSKDYLAEISFGTSTDSADGDGVVTATSSGRPTREQIESVLEEFVGSIQQTPPAHSAIKIGGKRAYEFAHAGIDVQMPSRNVTISRLDLCAWDGDTATVFVSCSKGTYIRSLARDIGIRLDIPSYMSNLARTRSGPFHIEDAWTLSELSDLDPVWFWEDVAVHPDMAINIDPAIVLSEAETIRWSHGQSISRSLIRDETRARVYDSDGHWRGVARQSEVGIWNPWRVISP
jgi:tRNA pseudouridine55 synthase